MTFLKMRVFLYKLFTQPRGLRQAWLLGSDVVRIGPKVLLKHHGTVRPTEAFTMDFVRRQTHLPVPAVHDVFLDRRGHVYIMMDYIDAPELQAVWRRLSLAQRSAVVQELVTYLVELRALSPPDPNAVQAVDGGSLIDVRLGSEPFGPFAAVDDFHMYLGHTIIHDRLASNHPYAREALERCRHRTYRIIFSHSDLAPRNILYKDGHIAAIIDWEFSGWYPEYWEFTRTFDSSSWIIPEFWELFKAHFEGQYDDELVMEHVLSAEMTR
ncbi:hypothetical protein BS47DRAFT_533384 [Hydnum rufescens UP504]|uniref:Aminoglycoside phosphotransferase domain-containing protein n=1 Tax=Hydnum rufescens UP504 TaxID=1448309 RepID=A0A9P6E0S4_9AGAM|nr:hypothetical protein BS47DRAFT_533384 [Hydnum rufescens UP504]